MTTEWTETASTPQRKNVLHEDKLQREILAHIRKRRKPRVLYLHPPNGADMTDASRGRMLGLGMFPGAADLLIVVGGRAHWIELKAEDNKQDPEQILFQQVAEAAGCEYQLVKTVDDALDHLVRWGAIHPEAQP